MVTKKQIKMIRLESLIDYLLSNGYITLRRKYSKYLPPPQPVKGVDIDVVAKCDEYNVYTSRFEKKLAVGIILSEEELDNENITSILTQLINTHSNSGRKVILFVGVPSTHILKADMIIQTLDYNIKTKIKVIPLQDRND